LEHTQNKKRSNPITSAVLWLTLLIGIGLIAYPRIDSKIQQNKQDALLAHWSEEFRVRTSLPSPLVSDGSGQAAVPTNIKLPQWKNVEGFQLLGSLQIDSIDLNEPIIRGADVASLKEGAGSVVEDRLPGQAGNFVLAGHRSWTFGRHFNRLDELKLGDDIEINSTAGSYHYVVTDKLLVLPNDLSVLNNHDGETELTLITCHPKRNPTHRLIILAKLQTTNQ